MLGSGSTPQQGFASSGSPDAQGLGGHRPPAPGHPVRLADGPPYEPGALFVVTYEDEEYAFVEGAWGRFGRDDARIEIPVWEEVRRSSLSRVAGELWCYDGELWLRNLSTSHELTVAGTVGRPHSLPPRSPGTRGPACSLPTAGATITAPSTGSWSIRTAPLAPEQVQQETPDDVSASGDPVTIRIAVLPENLRPVATELCAPMLLHGGPPATYDEIAAHLGVSRRQARRYVDKLCDHFRGEIPASMTESNPGAPHYTPVAELLVGLGRITRNDVTEQRRRRAAEQPPAE